VKKKVSDIWFGGTDVPKKYTRFSNADIVIIPCPYDLTSSYQKGSRNGPDAICAASNYLELFDEELEIETYKNGIYTSIPLPLGTLSPEKMVSRIEQEVHLVLKAGKIPVLIGGEHSVSIGAVRILSRHYKNLSVLHFDAHHDLRNSYDGSTYNHACVARRFIDCCPLVQAGMRSMSIEEQYFLNTKPAHLKRLTIYDMRKKTNWKKDIIRSLSDTVYISLDLDVLDPSIMPSVGTPEPDGMLWHDLLEILRLTAKHKRIVGFDIVELLPIKGLVAPDFLAAKLIYRLLGYICSEKNKANNMHN